MTVKELSQLLTAAERHTEGVTVTFYAILLPDSVVTKMKGYVQHGHQARVHPFDNEKGLRLILKALGGDS